MSISDLVNTTWGLTASLAAMGVTIVSSGLLARWAVNVHARDSGDTIARDSRPARFLAAIAITLTPVTLVACAWCTLAIISVIYQQPLAQQGPSDGWAPFSVGLFALGWIAYMWRAVKRWRNHERLQTPLNEFAGVNPNDD